MSRDDISVVSDRLITTRCRLEASDWEPKSLFSHAGLAGVIFPIRDPGSSPTFDRSNGRLHLRLRSVDARTRTENGETQWSRPGLPYGAKARLLMIHLATEAIRTQSPVIEIDDSLTAFCERLSKGTKWSLNGRNIRQWREQLHRLAHCELSLGMDEDDGVAEEHLRLIRSLRVFFPASPRQRCIWPSVIRLSPGFYESLVENRHALPLERDAIGALQHSSRALDIYTWLAHRLCRVEQPILLTWPVLRRQFGDPAQNMGAFQRRFRLAMKAVLMVYPRANVTEIKRKKGSKWGVQIRRSPPPVPFSRTVYLKERN